MSEKSEHVVGSADAPKAGKAKARLRLMLSALVPMLLYGAWAYYANSLVTDDQNMLMRAAITQGVLSGTITLLFTLALEKVVDRWGGNCYSLVFITPILCGVRSTTPQNLAIFQTFRSALDLSAKNMQGKRLPGSVLAPLLPILLQSAIAISAHLINQTPNIALTVAPSIFFSAIYGYVYTFALLKDPA